MPGHKGSVSSSKNENQEWTCNLCKDKFTDEKAELLECEVCEERFCRKCLKLSVAEYKFMSKRGDVHWYCPPCEEKARKNLKIEKEVQERCKEYFEKMDKRMNILEKRLEEKADKSEVAGLVNESIKKIQEEAPDATNNAQVEEQLSELRESEARKNNVIIHGLEESSSAYQDTRVIEDTAIAEELCKALEAEPEKIDIAVRLGKKPINPTRPRPLKIEFADKNSKATFMRNLNKIPTADKKFAKVRVAHDMTKKEREENKKRVQEARELNESETSENFRHIVVGPPWERKVIRVKKKSA